MKKIIIALLSTFILFPNITFAESTVNVLKEDDAKLLLAKGISMDEIAQLGFHAEILADYAREETTSAKMVLTLKNGMIGSAEVSSYEPNRHPGITTPSPKEPERIPMKVELNGEFMNFDNEQPPLIRNGTVLIPLRKIFEALGAKVTWNDESYSITAQKDNTTVILAIGDKIAKVNGTEIQLVQAPEIVNEKTMVPVRFVSESFGAKVDWDRLYEDSSYLY